MAKNFILSATLELKNKLKSGLNAAQKNLKEFGSATTQASKKLQEFSKKGNKELSSFASAAKKHFTSVSKNMGQLLIGGATKVTKGMYSIFKFGLKGLKNLAGKFFNNFSVGMLGGNFLQSSFRAIKDTIKNSFFGYVELQDKLTRNKVLMGANAEQAKLMDAQVKKLGATTEYTAAQVADVHKYFAMAGWNPEGIEKATEPVLKFASATGTDLASAADMASDYLTAFGMKAEELPHLLDVMSKTALKSNTNITMLAETFKGMAGISAGRDTIEDLGVITGLLANMGTKGGDTGTFYKSAILRLTSGSSEVEQARKALGVDFYKYVDIDKNGKKVKTKLRKSTLEIFQDIKKTMSNFDTQGQDKLMGDLFGINHAGTATKLLNALGTNEFPRLVNEMKNVSGATEEMYTKWSDESPKYKIAMLSSAWEGLKNKLGETVSPAALEIIKELTSYISKVTSSDSWNPEAVSIFFKNLKSKIYDVSEALRGVLGVIKIVFQGINKVYDFVKFVSTLSIKAIHGSTGTDAAIQSQELKKMRITDPEKYEATMESKLASGDLYKFKENGLYGDKVDAFDVLNETKPQYANFNKKSWQAAYGIAHNDKKNYYKYLADDQKWDKLKKYKGDPYADALLAGKSQVATQNTLQNSIFTKNQAAAPSTFQNNVFTKNNIASPPASYIIPNNTAQRNVNLNLENKITIDPAGLEEIKRVMNSNSDKIVNDMRVAILNTYQTQQ